MKKQFAVIGLGRFGFYVAKTLAESGYEVLAIDRDEEKVKAVSDFITHSLVLDAMDDRALRSAGIKDVDVAVVSIGENIEASILVVMRLKELRIPYIVAKAVTSLHGRVLETMKVDRIIYPERDMAIRVAHSLTRPSIIEHLELSPEYSIVEIPAPEMVTGKSLKDSLLRTKYGVNVIAIKRIILEDGNEKEVWNFNPSPLDVIQKNDFLVLVGLNEDLKRLWSP